MRDDDVPVKTQEGLEEIKNRALGLAPRVRTALLLVDGVKSIRELEPLLVASGVKPGTLEILLEKGLISVSVHAPAVASANDVTTEAEALPTPQVESAAEAESAVQVEAAPAIEMTEPAAKAAPQLQATPAPKAASEPKAVSEPKASPGPESVMPPEWPVTISVDAMDPDLQDRELVKAAPVAAQQPKAAPAAVSAPAPAITAAKPAARSAPATYSAPKNNEPVREAPKAARTPEIVPRLEPVMSGAKLSGAKPLTVSVPLTEDDPYDKEMVHRVAVAPPPPEDMKLLIARAHLANALDDYVEGYILKQIVTGCASRAELQSLFDAVERVLVKSLGKVRSDDVMGTAKTLLAS
jgi:hypothetical protein